MDLKANILIVDDEAVVRDSLGKWFTEEGYMAETAGTAREALLKLPTERWDLALLDIKMPGMDGLELQRKIREVHPEVIIVIMTGYASVETAVQALKDGAYDYITKPFDPDDLTHVIRKALEHYRMKQENLKMRESLDEVRTVDLVGQSPPMQKVWELIRTVAPTETTVLITGESGTGKELVARAIHSLSPRRYMPLVTIHCGALTETLLESELFGHEKGAFTGAQYRKKGKFEVAEAALDAGADIINDISSFNLDPRILLLAAKKGAGFILMHMKGMPKTMQVQPYYDDVVGEIRAFLAEKIEIARAYGLQKENVIIDPGIGFGKRHQDNLVLLNGLDAFSGLDRPILIGVSRKSFIGKILNAPPEDRLEGTIAASVVSIVHGAHILRVHDVKAVKRAVLVAEAILNEHPDKNSGEEKIGYAH
ncbi:MAG: dihydropteroate synthase [Acidobacteriia bacterium]|nr:dihydropteroate synthase [Terriglobia bacterium]